MTEDEFDKVVDTYPYPIAGLFSRLGTVECMDPYFDRRLNCILEVAEAISRFLSALVLCQCRDYAEEHPRETPPVALRTDFRKHLKRPSWGHWLQFTREGLKWLMHSEAPAPLIHQLAEFYFDRVPRESKSAEALGRLLTVRNDREHGRTPAHYTRQLKALSEETYAELVSVIHGLRFLADYSLTFVHQIEVWKRRHHDPDYRHSVVRIRAGGGDFRASRKSLATPLESQSVMILGAEAGPYLNLDPFLVYEHASGAAPDLFFFNGMDNPSAMEYVACRQGGSFLSAENKNKQRATELAEEMESLLNLFVPRVEDGLDGR